MTTKDTLFYIAISVFSQSSPERLPPPADGKRCKDQPDTTHRESIDERSPSNPPLNAQGALLKRRQKDSKSQRWWRMPGKQGPLHQLNRTHMSSHRMKQQARASMSLYQVIYISVIAISLVFRWDF